MLRLDRHVWLNFHIDTNRINSRRKLAHMNRIEKWADDDVIFLEMSQVAQDEAVASGDPERKYKAYAYGATETLLISPHERRLWREIEKILSPAGTRAASEKQDVEIVFNAIKYDAILITDDGDSKRQPGGILGNRERLKRLGLVAMRDEEVVKMVEELIRKRDRLAKRLSQEMDEVLPSWVGMD